MEVVTPPILYQTYKNDELPIMFSTYQKKWLEIFNGEYKFLNDEDLRQLVATHFPKYLPFYDGCKRNIERVDFARYIMMYLGGVYADMDTYPLKPIDVWINKNKIVLGREPIEHANDIYKREIVLCNAFMISPPGQQLWIDLMDFIVARYQPHGNPVHNTGPMAMTRFFEYYPEKFQDVIITDPCVFFPLLNNGQVSKYCRGNDENPINPLADSYVVHAWSNTWTDKWAGLRNPRYWIMAISILAILFLLYINRPSRR